MGDNSTAAKTPVEISLALSGGAARGAFHLGFIDTLQKRGVKIAAISGTSAGAMVGASIASGKTPTEILEFFKSKAFRKTFHFNWFRRSFFRIDASAEVFKEFFPFEDLSEAKIKLYICVTDLKNNQVYYHDKGDAKTLIKASSALVPIFEPVTYQDTLLADGGFKDLLPTTPLKAHPYPILGINLVPNNFPKKQTIRSLSAYVTHMMIGSKIEENKKDCSWYIAPPELDALRMLSFKDLDKAFALGSEHANKWCDTHL